LELFCFAAFLFETVRSTSASRTRGIAAFAGNATPGSSALIHAGKARRDAGEALSAALRSGT
jgi:hypothetical protein